MVGLSDSVPKGFRPSTKLILATTTASRHGEVTFRPHLFVMRHVVLIAVRRADGVKRTPYVQSFEVSVH
jgi:hypothetical protein